MRPEILLLNYYWGSILGVKGVKRDFDQYFFYIHGSVHRDSILIRTNKMQVFIYCKITLHVSGVYRTHQKQYIKL